MGLWDKQNEVALQYAINEKGMKVINLSPEEKERWIKLVEPIQNEYVTKINQQGLPGQATLDTVKQLSEKYNVEYK
jgi:TRAP-type C4-dicarboxylate transport system substrate-binding protein